MTNDNRTGDVTKLWLTTPTFNVYAMQSMPPSLTVMPRQGLPGKWRHRYANYESSLFDLMRETIAEYTNGERFISGVTEFDTEDQIRFELRWAARHEPLNSEPFETRNVSWKIRGTTYHGSWADAADVDDATLVHRAIVAYQAYRSEQAKRDRLGDE